MGDEGHGRLALHDARSLRRRAIRLDHIALRVKDRDAAIALYTNPKTFGYKVQSSFDITLEDGSKAVGTALEPPEKELPDVPFLCTSFLPVGPMIPQQRIQYHLAPEIFLSSGPPGSLIDEWVNKHAEGIGGVHHLAYQVDDVRETMRTWIDLGFLFTTDDALSCEDLTQVFTRPSGATNLIYEFIKRGQHGFCAGNVGKLMSSTRDLKA